ncbi:MAG: hypothetical protein ACYC5M_08520 [Anaerolineae bacterium]
MKTTFALFGTYDEAREAIDQLVAQGLGEEQMNAIVLSDVAREHMDVNREKVKIRMTDAVGERTVLGLAAMLGGEQPVQVPEMGRVLAAGDEATILTKHATNPGAASGFREALLDFMAEDVADAYLAGVKSGGILYWIRSEDDRAGEVANILRQRGQRVGSYGPGHRR